MNELDPPRKIGAIIVATLSTVAALSVLGVALGATALVIALQRTSEINRKLTTRF